MCIRSLRELTLSFNIQNREREGKPACWSGHKPSRLQEAADTTHNIHHHQLLSLRRKGEEKKYSKLDVPLLLHISVRKQQMGACYSKGGFFIFVEAGVVLERAK